MLASELIEQAIRDMQGPIGEEMNKLSSPVGALDTSISLTYELSGLRSGSIITIGSETLRVWTVNATSQTAEVERGFGSTNALTHDAGALIYVNPRISRPSAFQALNYEIADISSPSAGLFQVKGFEFTPTSDLTYDLTGVTSFLSAYKLQQKQPALNQWVDVSGWRVIGGQNPADYSSGMALHVPALTPGFRTRLLYRAPFDHLTSMDDSLEDDAGVPVEMHDILMLGILTRLGPMREIQRNFTESQGNARRAEEVPGGSILRSYAALMQRRQDRINAEAARLMRLYP